MSASEMSIGMIEQVAGKGAARAARRRRGMDGGVRRPGWVTYALLAVIVLVSAFPLYYAFLLSSSTSSSIAQNPIPSPIPEGHFIENITRVLTADINFWRAVLNSVIVAVLTSVSVVFFSTLAGYAFAKLRFRGQRGLLAFVVGTMAVPTQLGIIPLFIVMAKLGWVGNLAAVIVPAMVTAFGVFWMTQYLAEALPYELIEAARVDGCSMIETFCTSRSRPRAPPPLCSRCSRSSRPGPTSSGPSSCWARPTPPSPWRCSCCRPPTSRTWHSSWLVSYSQPSRSWRCSRSPAATWCPASWQGR